MILRKPTRIQLKPEQDLQEYDDFKKKINDSNKITRSNESFKDNRFGSIIKFNRQYDSNRSNIPHEFYRTPNSDSSQRNQPWNHREEPVSQLFSSLLSSMNPEGMESVIQTPPQRGHQH